MATSLGLLAIMADKVGDSCRLVMSHVTRAIQGGMAHAPRSGGPRQCGLPTVTSGAGATRSVPVCSFKISLKAVELLPRTSCAEAGCPEGSWSETS